MKRSLIASDPGYCGETGLIPVVSKPLIEHGKACGDETCFRFVQLRVTTGQESAPFNTS